MTLVPVAAAAVSVFLQDIVDAIVILAIVVLNGASATSRNPAPSNRCRAQAAVRADGAYST